MYSILNKARIPFDVVLSDALCREKLKRYSVLILPNVALISDQQREQIEAFVEQGALFWPPSRQSSTTKTARRAEISP